MGLLPVFGDGSAELLTEWTADTISFPSVTPIADSSPTFSTSNGGENVWIGVKFVSICSKVSIIIVSLTWSGDKIWIVAYCSWE
jgi:hypothetical protein